MKYEKIVKGIFLSRPNRFIADVFVDGIEAKAHVKNTGRCEELLITGATVYLEDHFGRMGSRKLRYSLIGIEKDTESGPIMVNMDSPVSYTHLRAHETGRNLVCRLLLEKKKTKKE